VNIDFIGKRRIYYAVSLSVITLGILFSIIFGVKLDIQFTGGAIITYSYTGDLTKDEVEAAASQALGTSVSVQINTDIATKGQRVVLQLEKSITPDRQKGLLTALQAKFPSNGLTAYSSNDVSAQMGREFIMKSLLAVALAIVLIIVYIWIRFRHIGGLPAGLTAFVSLAHDVTMVFVAFAIFRIPLNDSFIAVVLTILGYSINDTIVIYDRIRENRKLHGSKLPFKEIVNKSINQSLMRSVNTSLLTFIAIAVVCIFAILYGLSSIRTFALPMMIGVLTGCYSTICIAGPLWVTWNEYREKRGAKGYAGPRAAADRPQRRILAPLDSPDELGAPAQPEKEGPPAPPDTQAQKPDAPAARPPSQKSGHKKGKKKGKKRKK
jgi:preprotein translocase subunit SecF